MTCDWKGQVDYDDVEGTLSAPYVSEDVGADDYELKLSATPPPSTPQLRFEAPLGGQQVETFTFRAFTIAPTDFKLSVGRPEADEDGNGAIDYDEFTKILLAERTTRFAPVSSGHTSTPSIGRGAPFHSNPRRGAGDEQSAVLLDRADLYA